MYIIYAIIKLENNQESETYKPQVYMFPDACSINTMWKLYFNFLFPVLLTFSMNLKKHLKFRESIGNKITF